MISRQTIKVGTLVLMYDQEARTQKGMIRVVRRTRRMEMPSTPMI